VLDSQVDHDLLAGTKVAPLPVDLCSDNGRSGTFQERASRSKFQNGAARVCFRLRAISGFFLENDIVGAAV